MDRSASACHRRRVRSIPPLLLFAAGILVPAVLLATCVHAQALPDGADLLFGVNEAQTKVFPRAVQIQGAVPICIPGEKGFTLSANRAASVVRSRADIESAFGVSSEVSARFLFGGFGLRTNFHSDRTISGTNLNYHVVLQAETDQWENVQSCNNLELTDQARTILLRGNDEDILAFWETYGTHFYIAAKYGLRYSLLYIFKSQSESTKRDFSLDLSIDSPAVDAHGNLHDRWEQTQGTSDLEVSVHAAGIPGTIDLPGEGTVPFPISETDPAKVDDLCNALVSYLADATKPKKIVALLPVGYEMFPEVLAAKDRWLRSIQMPPDRDLLREFREEALKGYYDIFTQNKERIARLNRKLTMATIEEPLEVYSPEQIELINRKLQVLSLQNAQITSRATRCAQSEKDPTDFTTDQCEQSFSRDPFAYDDNDVVPIAEFKGVGEWNLQYSFPRERVYTYGGGGSPNCTRDTSQYYYFYDLHAVRIINGVEIARTFDMKHQLEAQIEGGFSPYRARFFPLADTGPGPGVCCCMSLETPGKTIHCPQDGTELDGDSVAYGAATCPPYTHIGTLRPVIEDCGHGVCSERPDFFLGRPFSDRGNLRIVEDGGIDPRDGLPHMKLQITLWDELGFVKRITKRDCAVRESPPTFQLVDPNCARNFADIDIRGRFDFTYTAAAAIRPFIDIGELPQGYLNRPYFHQFMAGNTSPPVEWVAIGTLPADLDLDASRGIVSGRPQEAGVFTFLLELSQGGTALASQEISIIVSEAELEVSTKDLIEGEVEKGYLEVLSASGGLPPYRWERGQGELPKGLEVYACGVLAGVPLQEGRFRFQIVVVDSAGIEARADFEVVIGTARECADDIKLFSVDANGDGTLDLSDAVYILSFLFSGGPGPRTCLSQ